MSTGIKTEDVTTIEGNKIIAEFMGLRFHKIGWVDQCHIDGNYECEALQYHSSWDWLMPVVEKICYANMYDYRMKIGNEMGKKLYRFQFIDNVNTVIISTNGWEESGIQAAYVSVLRYINHYNTQHPQSKQTV